MSLEEKVRVLVVEARFYDDMADALLAGATCLSLTTPASANSAEYFALRSSQNEVPALLPQSDRDYYKALFAAIDALGPVRHLVSPNKLHYTHIAAWKRRYPDAIAWASPGVRERAASQRIEVAFDADLGDVPEPAWVAELDQLRFRGSRVIEEVVFLHRASGTLILADLIENFEAAKLGTAMRWIARLCGVLDPDGKTPLDMRFTFRDRNAARACLQRIMAWQPRRVILAHGRCYLDNGEAELRRAFRWLG